MASAPLAVVPNDAGNIMEQVISAGDLRNLTPEQRVRYYMETCRSLGINPLTRPFDYIVLNGKLTLYANRGATDQLRELKGIDVRIVSKERIEDVYVITVEARTPNGRTDTDIGAVPIGNLKGADLANALMKTVTKGKRRVTLGICGLNVADESEIETIASAQRINVDLDTGEIIEQPKRSVVPPSDDTEGRLTSVHNPATARQIQFVKSVGRECGLAESDLAAECDRLYGVSIPELSRRDASVFIERLQARRAGMEMGVPPEHDAARSSATVAAVPTTSDDEDAATEAYAAAMGADPETGEILEADARPSLNHLHGLGAERNLDHAALKVLSLRWFGKESMKDLYADEVSDLEGLVKRFTPEEWPVLLRMVEGVDDVGFSVLFGHAVDLADAKTGADLKRIFKAMTDAGIDAPALMAVGARRKDHLKRLAEMGP